MAKYTVVVMDDESCKVLVGEHRGMNSVADGLTLSVHDSEEEAVEAAEKYMDENY